MNGSRHHVQDFDVAIRTLNRTMLITRRTWHRCNRQRLTLSVFVLRKFVRTDSVFIVQDTRETNTSMDLTETDNGKNYLEGGITFTFTPLNTRKPAIKTNIVGCNTVLDDHITTRASSMADLGRYCTLLVACKRTSSDFYGKKTHFSFDRAENMDSVQSDPRVVFSVADVIVCHRETRWYSDNAGVVFSVADVSLSSADSRSTVLS